MTDEKEVEVMARVLQDADIYGTSTYILHAQRAIAALDKYRVEVGPSDTEIASTLRAVAPQSYATCREVLYDYLRAKAAQHDAPATGGECGTCGGKGHKLQSQEACPTCHGSGKAREIHGK